jgi:hypothetical protein
MINVIVQFDVVLNAYEDSKPGREARGFPENIRRPAKTG